ncbi:trypsin-like serine protease [Pleomassaria siparia CBS 279.74]|uniref:Trypsin-like serine protease n=1 Tax=Pleomassaria siparia CBS 279.74 TaxID=1314801 RepID=A0A6G1KFB8_9PLEO|nr:trypsin-like serine protease [Pleomassaria siparia CBS 279.74]
MVNAAAAFALAIPAVVNAAAVLGNRGESGTQIVGGVLASTGDFPFIVSLQDSSGHFCGGSLLNANTVITAAHCTVGQTASALKVRAGSLQRASGGTLVGVSSIKTHPSFSSSNLSNDVAIWKLATAIPTSSTIGYVSLPVANSDPATGAITSVAGWGTTSSGSSSLPAALRKVDVPVISRTECRADYGTSAVTTSMFCAGYAAGGKDSCQGDSGGPIVDSNKVLLGTVSWGDGCAGANAPGVYSRVAVLLDFINANL